jgi:hypothetical protein
MSNMFTLMSTMQLAGRPEVPEALSIHLLDCAYRERQV